MIIEKDKVYNVDSMYLLEHAMKNIDFSYDIYFRMAVIREYLNNNDKIWDLYSKMQFTRVNQISHIPRNMSDHKDEFITLINNFKNEGYNLDYPILVDRDLYIIDGAHRMACSLFFEISNIPIYTDSKFIDFIPNEYTKEWFLKNGLLECIGYAEREKEYIKKRLTYV